MKYLSIPLFALILLGQGCVQDKPVVEQVEDSQVEVAIPDPAEVFDTTDDETVVSANPCTDPFIDSAIGRTVHPIADEYSHLDFLGQLFTADDCGGERIEEIFGVDDEVYTLGSTVWLEGGYSDDLAYVIEEVGFVCSEEGDSATCQKWQLKNTSTQVDELLRLKPFAQEILSDDCVNCG